MVENLEGLSTLLIHSSQLVLVELNSGNQDVDSDFALRGMDEL